MFQHFLWTRTKTGALAHFRKLESPDPLKRSFGSAPVFSTQAQLSTEMGSLPSCRSSSRPQAATAREQSKVESEAGHTRERG